MIEISKAAISEIKRVKKVREQLDRKFRIGLSTGGCKDFYYKIDLVESIDPQDIVREVNGIDIVIDGQQLAYLDRLKLDYSEDLMGGSFRFENSQATSVCGCGNCFSLTDPLVSKIVNSEVKRWQLPT